MTVNHAAARLEHAGVPRVLSIAGTDPTGGAGVQADLKSISAMGGYAMAVVTALVAQNTRRVRSVHLPPVSFLREQLDAVSDDVQIDGVKIGMLADAATVATVRAWLDEVRPPIVVLDPVMVATSGDRLLAEDAEEAVRDLCHSADLITPNVPELAVLADEPEAQTWADAVAQARLVSARCETVVLVKGGHLVGDRVHDALVDARSSAAASPVPGGIFEADAPRVDTTCTHGTGCTLSSAMATRLAAGDDWPTALTTVKGWLTRALRGADALHVGQGHGPVDHFVDLR
ncbi:bifunctional hydroxymethylpyrimidine kinase/phosphomethylpyrimidine kinase [Pseudoclavibacter sp. 13-3]|uniref:bifunctional hydroxymethylpyrimidine kinase/phosphomethylpyrimidine kinase n=1 Tax=Pseudoclavibacter sp. 13-3 TaxID=2901228 RepID=UPI001E39C393|nr:bifunctional hydroxymethylpyrimidine kinase/phosphomethylpyrimidine kinase [Pseudoclavibacter sp. 13-3]MCD7100655.1 bifunctional hydroxymethylpyrimidine kinase/phosphomethylpyrimidine kinase [Pseudoclavibacter sp. 13-3]